jgi:hypothetical protein
MSDLELVRKRIPMSTALREALTSNGIDPNDLQGAMISDLMMEALSKRSEKEDTASHTEVDHSAMSRWVKEGIDKGTETLADDIINTLSDEIRDATKELIVKHLATIGASLSRMDESQREMWDVLSILTEMLGMLTQGSDSADAKAIMEQLQQGTHRIDGELRKHITLNPDRQTERLEQERVARDEMALVVSPNSESLTQRNTKKGPDLDR